MIAEYPPWAHGPVATVIVIGVDNVGRGVGHDQGRCPIDLNDHRAIGVTDVVVEEPPSLG
jgi:hypothetical protein